MCVYRIRLRYLKIFIITSLILGQVSFAPVVYAQNTSLPNLPPPGAMIRPTSQFNPTVVKGITLYPDQPLKIDFIIDAGDDNLQGQALNDEAMKLIRYFMAAMTVPEDNMWVNLSPYEHDKIVPEELGRTELGRDMLAQDYLLKQLTASLIYPEDDLGHEFWQRVNAKALELYGTTDIPMETFNKVWIVPKLANVHVSGNNVFVVDNYLQVLLEKDYLALQNSDQLAVSTKSTLASEIIREIILPEIEREVNQGEHFANLRQIFNSIILAIWYKENLKQSFLGKLYVDQNKINGIDLNDRTIKQKIYEQYLRAFEQGVYDIIKEDFNPLTNEIIPRKYFSGGVLAKMDVGKRTVPIAQRNMALSGKFHRFAIDMELSIQNQGLTFLPIDLKEGQIRSTGYAKVYSEEANPFSSMDVPPHVQIGNNKLLSLRVWHLFEITFSENVEQAIIDYAQKEEQRFNRHRKKWQGLSSAKARAGLAAGWQQMHHPEWLGPPRIKLIPEEEVEKMGISVTQDDDGFLYGDSINVTNTDGVQVYGQELYDALGPNDYVRVNMASLSRLIVNKDGKRHHVLFYTPKSLSQFGTAAYHPYGGKIEFSEVFRDIIYNFGATLENLEREDNPLLLYVPKRFFPDLMGFYETAVRYNLTYFEPPSLTMYRELMEEITGSSPGTDKRVYDGLMITPPRNLALEEDLDGSTQVARDVIRRAVTKNVRGDDITIEDLGVEPLQDLPAPVLKADEVEQEIQSHLSSLPEQSVVFVGGYSGAGKTQETERLQKLSDGKLRLFPFDRYFKSLEDVPQTEDGQYDYDRPESFNIALAIDHIKQLLDGKRIELPKFDGDKFQSIRNSGEFMQLEDGEGLLVDWIHALYDPLQDEFVGYETVNIFIQAPPLLRLKRRLVRDPDERGRPIAQNIEYWPIVLHNERKHITPSRDRADFVIDSYDYVPADRLTLRIEELINESLRQIGDTPEEKSRLLTHWRNALIETILHTPLNIPKPETLGGIDFQPNNFSVNASGDKFNFNILPNLDGLSVTAIDGITPILTNVSIIHNASQLLQ